MRLLLASKSSTRREMLARAGVPFDTAEASLDEEAAKAGLSGAGFDARGIAEELAQLKAISVTGVAGDLVLGSDQTLELPDGTMLSKPRSRDDAKTQLRALAGTTHRLHSAAVIAEAGVAAWWCCETVELSMRPLSEAFLEAYLDREYEHIRWSVGGYRVEGPGAQLFDRIEGSHFAVLGMPLLPLLAQLRERGYLAR
ncbi:Maf-like protein [Sphingomonas parva]|uniref:Nucleoside triphosphate pyrophosphatase n=1 Tax=Sphingomonas parva TaxID=2555898 RepID=A0A4Y8ZUC8_9SPHN|nr:nucleoside triphosphate pyrophosphatase [Sphingomonas parva]TFI59534.1 Maf-like protein [Sphingomonas parva]